MPRQKGRCATNHSLTIICFKPSAPHQISFVGQSWMAKICAMEKAVSSLKPQALHVVNLGADNNKLAEPDSRAAGARYRERAGAYENGSVPV